VTSKERVKRAVKMQGPDKVPMLYAYTLEKSDVVNVEVIRHFMGPEKKYSEWGFEWSHIEKNLAMGQPKESVIKSWNDLEKFKAPDPSDLTRFDRIKAAREKYGDDKYYKANFSLSGFAILTMLRGFNNIMEDMYVEREYFDQLADIVFKFEEEIIKQVKDYGYDAIGLADDWGMQSSLFISPDKWREIFKPRYKRQIELAHRYGLDVYLHSCGYIYDIIGDLVEIGLDIINPGQPGINDVKRMGESFGGKICFSCPVSYQTTGITGNKDDIYADVREYVECLGSYNGGLIGIIPEDNKSLGLTQEKLDYMVEAFNTVGKYS
jgi:uroporphyrinogen-III decarboxylase